MLVPALAELTDVALFLLRVWLAVLFGVSGWGHLAQPRYRAESIGLPVTATVVLGAAEVAAALSLVLGLYAQVGAAIVVVSMLGAIYKKGVVWGTGFWGQESTGWYYEVLYLLCAVVILTTGGGAIALLP